MNYNIEFQACSLVILMIFLVLFSLKNKKWTLENIIFLRLIIGTIVLAIDDVFVSLSLANLQWPEWTRIVSGKGYLVIMHFCIATFLQYTIAMPAKNDLNNTNRRAQLLFYTLMPLCTITGIVSAIMPISYVSEGRNVHIYGASQNLCYICATISVLVIVIYTFLNREKISKKKLIPVYAYCSSALISAVLQFFFPYLLLSTFATTLSIAFIYIGLENPDLKLMEALDEAREEADRANRAKSDFLASMSHEIRTPINVVLGMNEMIMRESHEEATLDNAKNIQIAGEYLLALVNDILDFSKIESGKLALIPTNYDLAKLLEGVMLLGRNRAEGKNVDVQIHVDEDLPVHLFGDGLRFSQCISNLVSNAVKYTQSGNVDISISRKKCSEEKVTIRVMVKDTGIGIKEEDLDKLFKAFERLDEEKNRGIEGTGLGLSITRALLGMAGSQLNVISEYGKGSEFWFEVEQGIVDDEIMGDFEARIGQNKQKNRDNGEQFEAPDVKMLIVDDLPMNLMVITQLLKQTKIQITTAGSGAEALDKMCETKFDLILMDHMMPDMDGAETLEKSLTMEKNINMSTPVVAFTADATIETRELLSEKGFKDIILKPVVPATLEEKIKQYIK